MNSIFWHDYETTGTDPARDRPLQFAGIRTDESLRIIDEPCSLYCQPSRDTLPHPEACLITGITPQHALRHGLPEPAFIAAIHAQMSRPGTCNAGYNSIRFDDEVTRYCLYRNFYDPYQREWQNGNSRWDIIDMLRLTRALRPEGINWPDNEEGSPSFRLEHLTVANGIEHGDAHDALADVHATIAMARLVRERQPRLYEYLFEHRFKHAVASMLDWRRGQPLLHVSARLPRENSYTALMLPLAPHPGNKNAVIAFNLCSDPQPLLELDADEIRQRLFTPVAQLSDGTERIALKAIHSNRCPVVATAKLLTPAIAERLGIDLQQCEAHRLRLQGVDLRQKLAQVFESPRQDDDTDAELELYGGFLSDQDRYLLPRVRQAGARELASHSFPFSDKRYRELLFRYKARFYPESLTPEQQLDWQEFVVRRLQTGEGGVLSLDQYFATLDRLAETGAGNDRDRQILASLRDWGNECAIAAGDRPG